MDEDAKSAMTERLNIVVSKTMMEMIDAYQEENGHQSRAIAARKLLTLALYNRIDDRTFIDVSEIARKRKVNVATAMNALLRIGIEAENSSVGKSRASRIDGDLKLSELLEADDLDLLTAEASKAIHRLQIISDRLSRALAKKTSEDSTR